MYFSKIFYIHFRCFHPIGYKSIVFNTDLKLSLLFGIKRTAMYYIIRVCCMVRNIIYRVLN